MPTRSQLQIFVFLILVAVLQGCSNESDAVLQYLKSEGSILAQVGDLPPIDTSRMTELDAEEESERLSVMDQRLEKLSSLLVKIEELQTPPSCAKYGDLSRQSLESLIESDEAMRQAFLLIQKMRTASGEEREEIGSQLEAEFEKVSKATSRGGELLQEMSAERDRLMKEHGLVFNSED